MKPSINRSTTKKPTQKLNSTTNKPKQNVRVNHPDDLHLVKGVGSKLKWIGYIGDMCKIRLDEFERTHGHPFRATAPTTPVDISSPPRIVVGPDAKQAYINNDWAVIKMIQNQADEDLNPIYDVMKSDPDHAWVLVQDEDTGLYYHMAYGSNGSFCWTFTPSVNPGSGERKLLDGDNDGNNVKYSCTSQYGTYSKSGGVMGVHSYWIGLADAASAAIISAMLSRFICSVLAMGLDFVSAQLAAILTSAAAQVGLDAVFSIAAFALPYIIPCIIFIVLFIGIYFLIEWFRKSFTILVSIYNWDSDFDYQINSQALSNAINPGKDQTNTLNIKIPKEIPPGSNPFKAIQVPSDIGNQLIHTLEYVITYAYLVYENDSKWAQGLSFAFQVARGNTDFSTYGFTYAFECPWIDDNGQYMEPTLQDPQSFLDKARSNWVESTDPYNISIDSEYHIQIPIEANIDKLTGGDDDTYNIAIHINKKEGQQFIKSSL